MSLVDTKVFNNPSVVPRGWLWALRSSELGKGKLKALEFLGEDIVLYRGESGTVSAIGAYCVHMGAHLKQGRVVGDSIQCGYHGFRYNAEGECVEAPCLRKTVNVATVPRAQIYQVREQFGLIWIHSDSSVSPGELDPFPSYQELENPVSITDQPEIRNCHFTFILGSGVDEDHFNFVHRKTTDASGPIEFMVDRISNAVIRFRNVAVIPRSNPKSKLLNWLYNGTVVYDVTYWNGTTALARLGFPWLPMYSIFAYRPGPDGRSHAVNIYLSPRRKGLLGRLKSHLALSLTKAILRNGGNEDRPFQNSIRLRLGAQSATNPPFDKFVAYIEDQPAVKLGSVRP
jgi:nitrite reductase/ring-hydroxylating ferredoxin subunit